MAISTLIAAVPMTSAVSAASIAAALCAGLMLGAFFFGGLWWTVRKSLSARHPALLVLSSMLIRMGAVLAGLYFIGGSGPQWQWQRLLACLAGVLAARFIAMRLARATPGAAAAATTTATATIATTTIATTTTATATATATTTTTTTTAAIPPNFQSQEAIDAS